MEIPTTTLYHKKHPEQVIVVNTHEVDLWLATEIWKTEPPKPRKKHDIPEEGARE